MPFSFPKDSNNKAGAIKANADGNSFHVPVVIYGPDGITPIGSVNKQLVTNTTITWDGTKLYDIVLVPVTTASALFIKIDNYDQAKDLNVIFELEVSSGVWMQWYDGSGYEIAFTANGGSRRVYGGFPPFSRYLQARLKLTALTAPINTKTTIVQVQEVA